jgi:hypothetical protein
LRKLAVCAMKRADQLSQKVLKCSKRDGTLKGKESDGSLCNPIMVTDFDFEVSLVHAKLHREPHNFVLMNLFYCKIATQLIKEEKISIYFSKSKERRLIQHPTIKTAVGKLWGFLVLLDGSDLWKRSVKVAGWIRDMISAYGNRI